MSQKQLSINNMKYDLGAALEKAETEFNIGKGSDKFKFQEGDNKFRILSESEALQSTYMGNTSVKFLTWVWSYKDNALKLAFLPYSIMKAVAKLQKDPEYAFDSVPMPYDLTVNATKAGTKEVEYNVVAARTNTPVPAGAAEALGKEKSIKEVRDVIQANNATPSIEKEISVEDIPFNN